MRAYAVNTLKIIFLLSLVFSLGSTARADTSSPQALVEAFQSTLIGVMKDADQLSVSERYERLRPAVYEAFHAQIIVRIVTGDHWNQASKAQKESLIDAFQRMSLATLATLFSGYDGQVFKTIGVEPGPQDTTLVKTQLVDTDGTVVDIAYATLDIQGRPWVIDVILDNGISELSTRRSEYNKTLKEGGIDGLIELLNGKADQLLNIGKS